MEILTIDLNMFGQQNTEKPKQAGITIIRMFKFRILPKIVV